MIEWVDDVRRGHYRIPASHLRVGHRRFFYHDGRWGPRIVWLHDELVAAWAMLAVVGSLAFTAITALATEWGPVGIGMALVAGNVIWAAGMLGAGVATGYGFIAWPIDRAIRSAERADARADRVRAIRRDHEDVSRIVRRMDDDGGSAADG